MISGSVVSLEKSGDASYVINLYTSVRDEIEACELAAKISEGLAGEPGVYPYSTTVIREGESDTGKRVFVDLVAAVAVACLAPRNDVL